MARQTKVQKSAPDLSGAQDALREYAECNHKLKALEAKIEAEIVKLRKKHEGEINALKTRRAEAFDEVEIYAAANREALFASKKSADWTHAVIGFRTGTPKVKFARGYAKKAVELVKAAGFKRFIRTKEDLDKDRIISERENQELMDKLKAVAKLTVVQEETFFIDVKEEDLG